MNMTGELEIIAKSGSLLEPGARISLQHKMAYHHQLNDVHDGETEGGATNSNDTNNNNDYNGDESGPFTCPICQVDSFSSEKTLDEHVKCDHTVLYKQYSEMMESLNTLAIRSMMQANDKSAIATSKINFKLFHHLENKNALRDKISASIGSSPSYRCNFCGDHFSASQFMFHWKQCTQFRPDTSSEGYADDLDDYYDDDDDEETKSHFLAGLSLPRTRDESNHSNESDAAIKRMQKATASVSQPPMFMDGGDESNPDDDPFKSEVRDMKRRGEFPCRICHQIFRNLRALKGHSRMHIINNRGVRPYECNICSFSTNDKSIIIRHIRSHNGDHPYKCQLCFSTFTTKANCERHLRNAHHKTSRDDIKKLLVDQSSKPSQGNAGSALPLNSKFKAKLHSLLATDEKDGDSSLIKAAHFYTRSLIKTEAPEENVVGLKRRSQPADDSCNSNDSNNNTNTNSSVSSFNKKLEDYAINFNVPPLIDLRMANVGKRFYETSPLASAYQVRKNAMFVLPKHESDSEEPLDLSVDVLDLSRRKRDLENDCVVENLSTKSREYQSPSSSLSSSPSPAIRPLPAALPLFPKTELSSPRAFPPATNQMVSNLSSLFVSNAFSAAKICPTDESVQNVKIQPLIFSQLVANATEQYEESLRQKSTPEDTKFKESHRARPSSKSSTVKMVMKDGVLVEKQKQRRYRTEKPFSCTYCNGRFTLRSNMDRHVKQQHPGFWRQRQRGGSTRLRSKSKDECVAESVCGSHRTNEIRSDEMGLGVVGKRPIESDVEDEVHQPDKMVKKCDDRSDVEGEDEQSVLTDANTSGSVNNADIDEDYDDEELVIDEGQCEARDPQEPSEPQGATLKVEKQCMKEENPDLASVRSLLDNVSTQTFSQYFGSEEGEAAIKHDDGSEDDEEGLIAGSSSEGNGSGGEERLATDTDGRVPAQQTDGTKKKKSAYSTAPNRVHCDFCYRSFPWASSLRRHTLTHTGQKPYKCSSCPLLFTTKSNCDRHFLRKHRNEVGKSQATSVALLPVSTSSSTDVDSAISSSSSNASVSPTNNNCSSRNVPERPFKCSNCPSSTFSSLLNLKKHFIEKHNRKEVDEEGSAMLKEPSDQTNHEDEVDTKESLASNNNSTTSSKLTDDKECKSQCEQNYSAHAASDLPFKCHLCYRSFGERQEALDHMGSSHPAEFQQLISKGALDANARSEDITAHDDVALSSAIHSDENNIEQGRAHFPDYSSRKVICAFCMRRFWSAEDLRRHMRTHTGERPFACDICHRRFTLKHSMLRHRKKHSNKLFTSSASEENSPISDDEEPSSPLNGLSRDHRVLPLLVDNTERTAVDYTYRDEDNIVNKGPDKGCNNKSAKEDGVDLIAKLLDIEDRQLVDAMLTSKSADDVAKLLGVQK